MRGRVSQFVFSPNLLEDYKVDINYIGFRGAKDLDQEEKDGKIAYIGLVLEEENDVLMVAVIITLGKGKERADLMKTIS